MNDFSIEIYEATKKLKTFYPLTDIYNATT